MILEKQKKQIKNIKTHSNSAGEKRTQNGTVYAKLNPGPGREGENDN